MKKEQKLKLDWSKLSKDIFGEEENGRIHDMGQVRWIISNFIGKADTENAVLVYLKGLEGSELARNFLRLILSPDAMMFCKHVVDTPQLYKPIERQLAVELLRDIGDERILPWIDEFMTDEDLIVQVWAANCVLKLYYRGLLDDELLAKYYEQFRSHHRIEVRQTAILLKQEQLVQERCLKRDQFLMAIEDATEDEIERCKKDYFAISSELDSFEKAYEDL